MAGALALTCLENIGGTVLERIGGCLVASIKRQFTYLCCFNSNITELQTQLKKLETTRQGVQMWVDETRRNVRVIGPDIEDWRSRVNEVATEAEEIIGDKAKVKEGCLNGWCPNLKLRYSLSKKAVKKTEVVVKLWAEGAPYTRQSFSPPLESLEIITNRDFRGFESRKLKIEEIVKALKHDEINLIGVCGMGGVGKTTMVQEIAKRVKEEGLFVEVAMDVVGQEPNLTNVQARIADMLGLKNLQERESPMVRADLLRTRLQQDNKKVLVILDDIWKEFDLQAMGIPLEGTNKNFKMLYTSRIGHLWHDVRTKSEISLELLSKDEAWQLFREKAGDSADALDLQPIAKKIVNECGCLPLALVLIGSALSKRSGRNSKDIWEGMLDQLISSTPANKDLRSRLELSYDYLEDEVAKRLFLLCCLFKEDEHIRIEDLARYGLGLSFFDGINDMERARRRVFLIVDDLKSRYLLLHVEDEKEECVKVHDAVRDMGISIASKLNFALVSHGPASRWPKTTTHEHLTAISLISDEIEELPEGLTYPNLELLMLRCPKLKKLPPKFFEGMRKLKVLVLELHHFFGILKLQFLRNLITLSLEGFHGRLVIASPSRDLQNLEILNLRNSSFEELPEEIGKLVNLRVLDITRIYFQTRIPPGIISRLVHLEELYFRKSGYWGKTPKFFDGQFIRWEGEGKEEEGRNVNIRELGFLSNLNTLEIGIELRSNVLIPKDPIFSKLQTYKVSIVGKNDVSDDFDRIDIFGPEAAPNLIVKCKRVLMVKSSFPIPTYRGGIDSLVRRSDCLVLAGKGCNDLVHALLFPDGVDGLRQLKLLSIHSCETPEYFANTMNQVHPPPVIFPTLNVLQFIELDNLIEICRGPVPTGSFGELTHIDVAGCERLRYLFQLSVVGCLTQLKHLMISSCGMMEQVIWKEHEEEDIIHVATNGSIVFPKLEVLKLKKLPSLMGFCREIDQIDFPQLKELFLEDIPQINLIFHSNRNMSSNSVRNDDVVLLALFPQKVSLPNLEVLEVTKLSNLETLGHVPLLPGSLSKLKEFKVGGCSKLVSVFPSRFVPMLRGLERLIVERCQSLEVVAEVEGLDSNEPNPEILPSLEFVELGNLPKLNYISKRDPAGFKSIQTLRIHDCGSLRYVFAPTMTTSILQLRNLKIKNCEMLSRIVAEENGMGESSVDEVEFPQLETMELRDLQNLMSFFPNANVNTTLAKSTEEYHNPLQPQALFNEKISPRSLSKLKEFQVWGCGKLVSIFPSRFVPMLRGLKNLVVDKCDSLEVVFELEGLDSNEPNPEMLPSLEFVILRHLPKLNYISKRDPAGFKSIRTLFINDCNSLRYVFTPTMTKSISQLRVLEITGCKMLSRIVAEENGIGESLVGEVEFPQLETLELHDLQNLVSFFPNVNVNTTPTKSTDQYHNRLQPQALLNEKVSLEYLVPIGLQCASDLWGCEFPTSSFLNLENIHVTGCACLRDSPFMSLSLIGVNKTKQGLKEVAQLLYTNTGDDVLALGSNGNLTIWRWDDSQCNPSGKATATASVQLQPSIGFAMTNDGTGVNLNEAVPCMAIDNDDNSLISACGGKISIFWRAWRFYDTFMPPPPASTFLAFHPQKKGVIAIGMEDSTILIAVTPPWTFFQVTSFKVISKLEGHKMRITGLAFSTNLNILVSSGADAQLCIWRLETWEKLNSIPIHLPAGKEYNSDTRVQFHSDRIRLLVSHQTQLAIYDAAKMECILQWLPQDVLLAPISFAAYSCNSLLIYASFCDGNIGVFDADSLTLKCHIAPSIYLSPALLSGSQVVYPKVVATHPKKPNQIAIGLTQGSVILMELQQPEGQWGMLNDSTASSSTTSNHTPIQEKEDKENNQNIDHLDADKNMDEDEEGQEERRQKAKEKGKGLQFG